ncbi:MAG: type II toxin-antitoxin system VapC family toxin [Candidatus Dormibacteria bacterium]
MIYLDSSALLKLLFQEPESEALSGWLSAQPDLPKLTSQLSVIEVVRVCRRLDTSHEPAARSLLAGLDLMPVSSAVVDLATRVGTSSLRSLDAIQLATALLVRDGLAALVAYDHRLVEAAKAEQLPVMTPA